MKLRHKLRNSIALVLICLISHCVRAENYGRAASSGGQVLQQWYDPATGLYLSTGWWNSANIVTVLMDYAKLSRQPDVEATVARTFKLAQKKNPKFLNKFYDDEGWWALAWIDVYDVTGKSRYLRMSESIFADMTGGWEDSSCGGGIWWSKSRAYKNAIANELFLSVASHLANRTRGKKRSMYEQWANREWSWFRGSGMINSKGLVNDGLDKSCQNNRRTTWTYNQGVVVGGLVELSKLTGNPDLLREAGVIANAATSSLVDESGILHDRCEPRCGADSVQFKGIFVRNLSALQQTGTGGDYSRFIDANASSILTKDRNDQGQFGQVWSGPVGKVTAGTQSSALDAIIAAAQPDVATRAPQNQEGN